LKNLFFVLSFFGGWQIAAQTPLGTLSKFQATYTINAVPELKVKEIPSFLFLNDSLSPDKDSFKNTTVVHSPKKASIYSLVLPGAGQVYNHKYWKVPIIYGLLGGTGYGFYTFNKDLNATNNYFRSLYSQGKAPTPLEIDDRNTLRNRRDLVGISFVLVYVLQVVDATVDAHFYKFDINQKLSLGMDPEKGQLFQLTYQISGR